MTLHVFLHSTPIFTDMPHRKHKVPICILIFQSECAVKCLRHDCESLITTNSAHNNKRCDLYRLHCMGLPGPDRIKWNRESSSCSKGLSRFGTAGGCYRLAGTEPNGCSWDGTREAAETWCNDYGPKIHLAGILLKSGHCLTSKLSNSP